MKTNVLVALSIILFSSVAADAGHHEAEEQRTVVGMGFSGDGEPKPLYSGNY